MCIKILTTGSHNSQTDVVLCFLSHLLTLFLQKQTSKDIVVFLYELNTSSIPITRELCPAQYIVTIQTTIICGPWHKSQPLSQTIQCWYNAMYNEIRFTTYLNYEWQLFIYKSWWPWSSAQNSKMHICSRHLGSEDLYEVLSK